MRRKQQVPCLLESVTDEPSTSSPVMQNPMNRINADNQVGESSLDNGSKSEDSSISAPNLFDSVLTPLNRLSSNFEEEIKEKLCDTTEMHSSMSLTLSNNGTAQVFRDAIESSSDKEVRAFVDVSEAFDKSFLQDSLRKLGASVLMKFTKDVTHLVFWNGLQDILDKAYQNEICPFIVAPQWIQKSMIERKFVDEKPYCLYGFKGLALPFAEMAKGRVGRMPEMRSARKRSAIITALEQSASARRCKRSRLDNSETSFSDVDPQADVSDLMYAIETLSDHLAPALASLENSGVTVTEVMTPLFNRIRQRVQELNCSGNMPTSTTSEEFVRRKHKVLKKTGINRLCTKRSPPIFDSSEESGKMLRDPFDDFEVNDTNPSAGSPNSVESELSAKSHTIPSNGLNAKASSFRFEDVDGNLSSHTQQSSGSAKTASSDLTLSEPAKRRGRPWIPAEKMTPLQFERAIFRRYPKTYRSHLKMNFDEKLEAYQKYLDRETIVQEGGKTPSNSTVAKLQPVAVRTKSKVLNDLQVINSSEEFVHSHSSARSFHRKPGNIVLSAISESDREFLYAIVRRLGILRLTKNVDDETRFVIGDDQGSRTLNVMSALVNGIPVVSKEWAYRSLDNMSWLSAQEFLLPKWKAAYRAYRKGRLQQLFSDFGPFYVSNRCSSPSELTGFIEKCGGKVIESLSRAVIFIAPRSQWEELTSRLRNDQDSTYIIPENWVLDSIMTAKVCNFEQYTLVTEPT